MMNKHSAHYLPLLLASLLFGFSGPAVADILPPNLDYQEDTVDLKVKVMGGYVTVKRTRESWEWDINSNWKGIGFTFDNLDGSIKTVTRNGAEYIKKSPGVFALNKHNIITVIAAGYRWQDRAGNWIEYDQTGRTVSYGDRNNVKVSLQYDNTNRITGVFDHFDNQVLWYEYTGDYLIAIRDYTNRRVQYEFSLLPNSSGAIDLTKVTDVRGNVWTYGYAQGSSSAEVHTSSFAPPARRGVLISRTDPEGRTKRIVHQGSSVSEKDDDNIGTTYLAEYDAATKITYIRETSPTGKIAEIWTDAEGKVIRRDINGKTVSTTVSSTSSRTDTTTDERGNKTTTVKDEWDNIVKITHPDGTVVSATYDPVYSNITQRTDERGVITQYQYDLKGNLTKRTEAFGRPEQRITEYTYDPYGNKTQEKRLGDANTQEVISTYEYDTRGNVIRVTDPETNPTAYTYDVMGNALTKLDARGKTWTKTYDAAGHLTSDKNPLLHTIQYQYDKVGRCIKVIDALNNITQYAYDARDTLLAITDANIKTIQYTYHSEGQKTQVTDQEGKIQRYEYDLDGRLIKTIDGNNNVVTSIYGDNQTGSEGLLIKTIYPTYAQEFKYDSRNRLTQTTTVLDVTTRHTTTISYDAIGNRTVATDSEGKATQYSYDALNRLAKITNPASGVTEYTYDNRGNVIALKDPKNSIHRFQYDKNNRKTKEIRPMGQTTAYAYDVVGGLNQMTDPKGQIKKYSYDDAGRRIAEAHFTAGAITPIKTINYSYNERGALTGYDDGTTSAIYIYDNLQRKIQEIVNYGAFSLSYSYTYYANGLKKSFTGPDGIAYSYTYDANNQLSSTQLPIGAITINSYQWTAPAQITLPGGTIRQQQYDPLMRLTGITVKDPSQSIVMNYQYTYDRGGNILTKNTEQGNHTYTYDNLYRLTQATYPSFPTDTYTYDAVGNRLTDAQTPGSWTYSQNNQLIIAGNMIFDYDENGNTIKKTEGTQTTQYLYDTSDRLIEAKNTNSVTIVRYYYDPFGKRRWKEANNTKTHFLYTDEGLAGEYDQTGAQIKAYGYQPNGTWGTNPMFVRMGTTYSFYQNDALGTPQKLGTTSGSIGWSAIYAAFGATNVDSASTITNDLRFPGQQFDQETGLHYNWHRYYDPSLGRYISRDPLASLTGPNSYEYVSNNPLIYADPTGLIKWTGTQTGLSGGVNSITAGFSIFQLQTKCKCGKKASATVFAFGTGRAYGGRISFGFDPSTELTDFLPCPDPSVFNGFYSHIWGGFELLIIAAGFESIVLGGAHSTPGFDVDFSGGDIDHNFGIGYFVVIGGAIVTSSKTEKCCEIKE